MKKVILSIVGLVFVGLSVWLGYYFYKKSKTDPVVYKTENPFMTTIVKKTVATGSIIPRREVAIKPQVSGFVRSYVISTKAQQVYIEAFGRSFNFKAWETIHMENSRKFTLEEIAELATFCGYAVEMNLFDNRQYFADSIWKVVGKSPR